MANESPRQLATREGIRAAQREHQRLGSTFRERIDIFEVIEDQQIWLMFQRLRSLYGAYQRYDQTSGIILNSQHPVTLQRFTAAHEYGHHVLGHQASADEAKQIVDRPLDEREIAAQAFAGEFLMPLQLVNYTLRVMGLHDKGHRFTPREMYQVALELGVSYGAAVTQLVGQHKLTVANGRRLREASPLEIKTALAGIRPEHSWADVWLLDEAQEGREFSPYLRDEIHVVLQETPSSGYVWEVVQAPSALLAAIGDSFDPVADEEVVGASGRRHVSFRVSKAGSGRLRLEKRRPWLGDSPAASTFEATIRASGPIAAEASGGLSDDQRLAVLAGGAAA